MSASGTPYPVRVDAQAEPEASRGLWLVKWVMLIPHLVVLAFLWLAFVLISIVAFFAILFTGRYPRALFEFNVGVLRWSWRVSYYGYAALGTDRYPPFTLADVADYPAHLEVAYPERLSRGLVLVKWWLLALPHYIITAVFVGGGIWLGTRGNTGDVPWNVGWGAGGLVGLLVLIAAVVLLFTGRYPRALYDFVLGMDRWVLRVAAYAGLMTDAYPPFRLDMGGPDPGRVLTNPAPGPEAQPVPGPSSPSSATWPAPPSPSPLSPPTPQRAVNWTAGRVVSVVIGSVVLFMAAGSLVAGGGLLWADRSLRDDGYISTPSATVTSERYAVVTDNFRLEGAGLDWTIDRVVGTVQLRGTPTGTGDLFLGIGPTTEVNGYLRGVGHTELTEFGARWNGGLIGQWASVDHPGGAPLVAPAQSTVWAAQVSGTGPLVLTWRPSEGDWTVVIMRADGAAGVAARVQLGATLPGLGWIGIGLLGAGVLLLAAGGLLVGIAVHRASQAPTDGRVETPTGPSGPAPGTGEYGTASEPSPTDGWPRA